MDDVLRLLDELFAPEADRWTTNAGSCWWDSFYTDRSKPVPFFVAKPDENLVSYLDRNLITPDRVLDLGCGPGRNALHLASAGFTVDAVDLSPAASPGPRPRPRSRRRDPLPLRRRLRPHRDRPARPVHPDLRLRLLPPVGVRNSIRGPVLRNWPDVGGTDQFGGVGTDLSDVCRLVGRMVLRARSANARAGRRRISPTCPLAVICRRNSASLVTISGRSS